MQLDDKTLHDDMLRTLGLNSAAILHELRAPLAACRAQLQTMEHLLKKDGFSGQEMRFQLIYAKIDHMSKLLEDYLLLSSSRQTEPEQLDLLELAEESTALLHSLFISEKVNVSINGSPCPVMANKRSVLQIIINLLVNALEAIDSDGRINLDIKFQPNKAQLHIADNGCGMDEEVLARIFEPFYTTKPTGNGLGLAICQQLAQHMGGSLRAVSSPGHGSSFYLTLPVA